MKKALVFDPYIDTLGGGERYVLSFCLGLIKYGYQVDLAWKDAEDIKLAEKRFGFDLSKINIDKKAYSLCAGKSSILERYDLTTEYDLVFWVSDGSLPLLFSKNNLVHFQVPFVRLGGNSLMNLIKSSMIHQYVYNSEFTRKIIERSLPKDKGTVLYPPIDIEQFKPGKKEKIILSVSRFDSPSHSKRQDILIRAFRELLPSAKGYKLIITGGLKGSKSLVSPLVRLAQGLPVEIIINPDLNKLKQLYSHAKIFWHAAGYGIDDEKEPEKVEHFGMTTVEAMSAGCVPVVIAKGGQKEIVSKGNGLLFEDIPDLVDQTKKIINDNELAESFSKSAVKRAGKYSFNNFVKQINNLL